MRKVFPETPAKSVKFQKKDEIPLNYAAHSARQISGACQTLAPSREGGVNRGRIETLSAGD